MTNKRFSECVVYNGTAYISGQVDFTKSRSVAAQTRAILQRIDHLLEMAGTNKSYLLDSSVYLSNIGDYEEMNVEWEAWIDQSNPPARSVVQTQLANPGWHVKISVKAAVPS